uniref:TPR_REGION domain-containing protein n=1 Tax=Panagrellus redivivus TaxID=6233 RepID=A0A7E4VVJ4_PANRE
MISRLAPSVRQLSQTAVRSHAFSSIAAPLTAQRSGNGHRSNNQNNGQQRQRSRRFGNGPKVAAPLLGFSIMVSLKDFFGIDKVQLDADPLKDKIKQSWLARKYGKYDEAVEILHNALPEATEHSDPLVLTRIIDELANTYFEKGDMENAEKCFRDVIQRLVRLHGKNDASPEFIGISLKMADIFAHKGDLDNAETGFRHCVSKQLQIMENHVKKYVLAKGAALEERHLVEAHGPAYSDPIALFGMCLEVFAHFLIEFRGDDRLQEAEEYIDEVLKITSHLYGTSSFRLMTVLNNFGAICVRHGRFELAKKYLAIGVDRIMHIDECSTLIVGYYCNYAEALFHTGSVEEALEYAKKATILAKDEGPAVLKYSQNFLKALEKDARAQGKTGGRWYSWLF